MHCHHIQHEDPCYCYINNENNTATYATDKDLLDHINNTDVHLTAAEKEKISALSGSTIETITKTELNKYATKEDLDKYLTKEEAGNKYLAHEEGGSTIDFAVNTTKLTLDNIELWLTYTNGVLKLNGRVVENDTPTPPPATTYRYFYAVGTEYSNGLFTENDSYVSTSKAKSSLTINQENGQYAFYALPADQGEPTFTQGTFTGGWRKLDDVYTYNGVEYAVYRTVQPGLGTVNWKIS